MRICSMPCGVAETGDGPPPDEWLAVGLVLGKTVAPAGAGGGVTALDDAFSSPTCFGDDAADEEDAGGCDCSGGGGGGGRPKPNPVRPAAATAAACNPCRLRKLWCSADCM